MEKLNLAVPAMYADHHVLEVRRILLALPGVSDIYASSAFHAVEVTYDPAAISSDAIAAALRQAGYLDDLLAPVEIAARNVADGGERPSFRHTAVSENTGRTIGFGRNTPYMGRPLWPCPGMGALKNTRIEEE